MASRISIRALRNCCSFARCKANCAIGTATVARVAMMARVIISSMKVKPRSFTGHLIGNLTGHP